MAEAVTGDRSAQSYSWTQRLYSAVADGASVVIPAPDFDFEYTDTAHASVSVVPGLSGRVFEEGNGVAITWKWSPPSIKPGQEATIVNNSGQVWPLGSDVYLYCPHLMGVSDNRFDVKHQLYSIEQNVHDLEARVKVLEGGKKA